MNKFTITFTEEKGKINIEIDGKGFSLMEIIGLLERTKNKLLLEQISEITTKEGAL